MKKQKGFTLIEIMIALMLGIIVSGGALSIYLSTIRGSTNTINSSSLNHDLDIVMQLMTNDLRRAGYWGGAVTNANSINNKFTQASTNIQIRNLANPTTVATSGNCILYSYDANGDDVVDDNEYYGFRLNDTNIQIRISGSSTLDCDNDDDDTWNTITDPNKVSITRLVFSFSPTAAIVGPPAIPALVSSSKCLNVTTGQPYPTPCSAVSSANLASGANAIETRQVNIIITGEISNDDSVEKVATGTVKIRNNKVFIQ